MKNQIVWHDFNSIRAGVKRVGVRNVALGLKKRGWSCFAAVYIITGRAPSKPGI